MAYRYGDRCQTQLFPPSLEDYVGEDDPVRAYDAFVEVLDLGKLGITLDANKVGNSKYDPKAMIKLLVYGRSYGLRSSRKLERATCHNVSFIWLLGGLKPDHKTIAQFRRRHKEALTLVQLQDELKNRQTLKARIESVRQELKEQGLKSLDTTDRDITVIVPSVKQAHDKVAKPFDKNRFRSAVSG